MSKIVLEFDSDNFKEYMKQLGYIKREDDQVDTPTESHDTPTYQWIPCSECKRRCDKWERSKTLQE